MSIKLITFDLDDTLWPVDDVIARAEVVYHNFLRQQEPALFTKLSAEDQGLPAGTPQAPPGAAARHQPLAPRQPALSIAGGRL